MASEISLAQNLNPNTQNNSTRNINLNKTNTTSEITINLNQKSNVDSSFGVDFSKSDYFWISPTLLINLYKETSEQLTKNSKIL